MEGKTPVATPRGTGKKEGNEKSGSSVMILHDTPMSSTPRDDIYSPVHGTDPRLYVIREGNSTLSTDMYEAEKAKAEVEKKIDHTIAEDPDADANDQQAQSGALAKTSRATTAVANNRATTAAQSRGGTNETNTENSTTTDIEGTTTVNTQNTTEVKKSKGGKKIQAKKSGRKLRGQIINKSPVKRSSGDKSHNERENPQQSYRQNGEQITASDSVQSRDENVRYEGNETPTNTGQQKVSSNTSTGLTNTQISRGTGAQSRQSNISNVSQTQGGKQNSVTSNTAGRRSSESSYASMDTPHPSEGWDTPLSSITDGGNTQRSEGQTQIETARGLKLTQVKCAWLVAIIIRMGLPNPQYPSHHHHNCPGFISSTGVIATSVY